MKRRLSLLALVTMSHVAAADPAPLLVVREMDPWRMVIGSDSAKFAVYDDGSVIYQAAKPTEERPFEKRKVENPKLVVGKLLAVDLAKMEKSYELTAATDQITTTIWTPERRIGIYGNWREPSPKAANDEQRKMWESLPGGIREFLKRVEKERETEGEAWMPESIEVMFWPYEYAPEESIVWPASWPDLKAATTKKREGDDFYRVFLPSSKLAELRKFMATRKDKGAVLINGKKMTVSYRFPFPGEDRWMRR